MCGIAGFIDHKQLLRDPESALKRMSDAIRLRGPDDEGQWFDRASGVGFSFRRLAIQDLSPEGHQPMRSRSGRYTIVFNGEVYNFPQLRTELASLGHSFRGGSDTEVMLAAFEQWGIANAIERFVGMFAFAAWDASERRLHLVRDRLGVKPLYWGHLGPDGRMLVFCSELKSLRALPLACPAVDIDAVALFVRFGYVPSPRSIFKGIHKLMPGHRVEIDAATGRESVHCYWSAREAAERGAADPIEDYGEALERVERCLDEAIRLRLISDVPLGCFLSGGVDSTLITAIAARHSSSRLRTYTIGFHEAEYDEAPYARAIARHIGTDHTELYVSASESIDLIPTLAEIFDEPFADSSAIPTYLLCKLARRDITVALCGDGGDELFGGYDRYLFAGRIESLLRRWPLPLRVAGSAGLRAAMLAPTPLLQQFNDIVPGSKYTRTRDRLRKLSRLLLIRDPIDVYPRLASVVKDPDYYLVNQGTPMSPMSDPAWCPRLECPVTRGAVRDMVSYMPDDILAKTDRASMAVSLEAREPLTDHRLVELALRIPARFKFADGRNKIVLRDLLDRHVPRELVERPKMGFSVPIDHWLRGDLRDWAAELLDPKRIESQGLLDAHAVQHLWRQHQSGDSQRQTELWNCLMLETWLRRWGPEAQPALESKDTPSIVLREASDAAAPEPAPSAAVAAAPSTEGGASARRQFAGGTYWGIVQVIVQKGSAFLTYMVAVWMLQPSDVGSVTTAISIATLLSFIFPGAAGDILMHRQSAVALWQTACMWLAVAVGLLLVSICAAASPLINWRYTDSPVAMFTLLAAVRVAFDAASMVALAKLRLLERFRALAVLDTILALLTLGATIVLCMLDFAGWALLLPMIFVSILRFVIMVSAASIPLFRPGSLTRAGMLWHDFRAGGLQHYLNGATQTVDYFAISLFNTEDVLGRYTIAYQLTFTVHVVLAYIVAGIAQPVFSRVQSQPERLRDTFVTTQRLTMAVAAPLFIGLAIASPVLVKMLLPERWELAWISISILSVAFLMMNPIQISAALLRARGRFSHLLRFQILQTVCLTVAVFAATSFGTARHVAFAVCLIGIVFGPLSVQTALGGLGSSARAIRDIYAVPLLAAMLCLAPQFLLLQALGDDNWASLGAQIASGVAGLGLYVIALRFLSPTLHGQVRGLLAEIRSRAGNPFGS